MSKMSKEFPSVILGLCHGQTENIFLKQITQIYLEHKFLEEDFGYYESYSPVPLVKTLGKGDRHLIINAFKKGVLWKITKDSIESVLQDFESKGENYKSKISFVTVVDIFERDEDASKREEIVFKEGHERIIREVLIDRFGNDEIVFDTKIIYFNSKIENHIKNYLNEWNKSDKVGSMIAWANRLRRNCDSSKEIVELFESVRAEDSNILSYFIYLDNIIEKIKESIRS